MDVFLFELDSGYRVVSAERKNAGLTKLLYHIAVMGNTVVLSLNQISDSPIFLSILEDETVFGVVIELIRMGKIQVSQYAGNRTAAQYVLNNIRNKEKHFEFSFIPDLSDEDKKTLDDAIQYCDLQLLRNKIHDNETTPEQAQKYEKLLRYTELVLALSQNNSVDRIADSADNNKLHDYLVSAANLLKAGVLNGLDKVILSGIEILEQSLRDQDVKTNFNRSNWRSYLKKKKEELPEDHIAAANAVIDLCYNYTILDSIKGIEKECDCDVWEDNLRNMFTVDFQNEFIVRIQKYWNALTQAQQIIQPEIVIQPKDWETALSLVQRNVDYASSKAKHSEQNLNVQSRLTGLNYRERSNKQRIDWEDVTRKSRNAYRLTELIRFGFALVLFGLYQLFKSFPRVLGYVLPNSSALISYLFEEFKSANGACRTVLELRHPLIVNTLALLIGVAFYFGICWILKKCRGKSYSQDSMLAVLINLKNIYFREPRFLKRLAGKCKDLNMGGF